MRESYEKKHLKRHLKTHKSSSKDESPKTHSSEKYIVSLLLDDQKLFNDKCQTGSFVKSALLTQNIEPQSLRKYMREALDIHECYTKPEMISCALKGWQKELLNSHRT